MHIPPIRTATLLATLLAAAAGPAWAGDGHDHDHDRARQALQAGEVLPLKAILARVERSHPGQVMEVELERKEGRWIYEIKLLRAGGDLSKLRVDARDGTVLERHAPDDPAERKPRQPGVQP
jgi:uncharacterized membrane protein YkoI